MPAQSDPNALSDATDNFDEQQIEIELIQSEDQQSEKQETTGQETSTDAEINHEYPQKTVDDQSFQEPSTQAESDETSSGDNLKCTLSVRCDTIFSNIESFDREKVDIIPADGVIYKEKEVTFYEGESVFNVLLREMKQNKIHMEFENIPLYNSSYIEGIGNIYEFDCGELSGWMYKVNGIFPNYGCSHYILKNNDRIEFVYTCNLGADVGGDYASNKAGIKNE